MNISQYGLTLMTEDDVSIKVNHFRGNPTPDNRTMIVLPATGARQERYFNFARFFAEHGWHVFTLDYRGMGESNVSALFDMRYSMVSWGRYDLDCCIRWAKDHLMAQRIVVTGHSIGGQIIPLAKHFQDIDAVLAVAAQKGYWKNWPAPHKWVVAAFFKVYMPLCLKIHGYVPLKWFGLDDLPRAVAQDYIRWTTCIDYLDRDDNSFVDRFEQFTAPILSLSFTDDLNYAPERTVDDLAFNYYKNASVWRSHVSPHYYALSAIGHSGFFDPKVMPISAWDDVRNWLDTILYGPVEKLTFKSLPAVYFRPGTVTNQSVA